ncbi:MAG: HlyC/CorC family transporter [Clostridia bacterium]|nr:HlyC/CorC family transporter [Clostridia bacterium]
MDDGGRLFSWLIIIVLLFLAMLFAAAETAFSSVSSAKLRVKAEKKDTRAVHALYVTEHFDLAITTMLICTNIVHLAAASLVTINVTKIWGVSAVTLSTLVTTLVVFFFGEMLPKSIARKYSEMISLQTAAVMHLLMIVLRPVATLLSFIGEAVTKRQGTEPEASVTEDELYDIIEDMTEEGTLDEEQGELISSALQFGDVTVESILTSRMDIDGIDIRMSQEEILQFIREHNHSRLPVYEGTIDNIIGILQIKKYMRAYIRMGKAVSIKPLLDEAYFVHQSTKIDDLLPSMSARKQNIAVVTDNYGGTLGIVTVEDILEELVGEIWDEDDHAVENVVLLPDGAYSVNAEEHLIDVLDELDMNYTEEEKEEIGNKLMSELAYESFMEIPHEGDTFSAYNLKITVQKMKHHRMLRFRVEKKEKVPEGGNAS